MNHLAPSILSADFANLERDIKIITYAGATYVHVDVMDGHFVPNLTIGAGVTSAIRKGTSAIIDAHLMISNPDQYIEDFIKAKADIITIHFESNGDTLEQIKKIKASGIRAAVAIKPNTPVTVLDEYLELLDMVLVMTVEPGFGGQSFMNDMVSKIEYLRDIKKEKGYTFDIQVDGGIKHDNVHIVLDAGANIIVAGSAIFNNDTVGSVKSMLELLDRK